MRETREKIAIDQLVKGLYVDLELSWDQHPFLFSRFKIKSDKDILAIKKLGLTEITIIPERSGVDVIEKAPTAEPLEQEKIVDGMWQEKNTRIEDADRFRKKRKDTARRYHQQAEKVKAIVGDMKSQPANALHNVDDVVEDLTSTFSTEQDLITNLVNLGNGKHTDYNHAVNVTMLSLMLGRAENLSKEELHLLGMGALLHDIGKIEIPNAITMKKEKLSNVEAKVLERHTILGAKLAKRVRELPNMAMEILENHHEFLDGSGYPRGLLATKLSKLVRMVTVVNVYDNFCNPPDPSDAVTPKTALAMMFTKFKDKLDRHLVERFIGILGVYPPGTVVQMSDESIGLVISADPKAILQPEVLLYNPDIPKEQALIVNLKEQGDLSIKDVLRPGHYPAGIYEYLGIQERLGYLIE